MRLDRTAQCLAVVQLDVVDLLDQVSGFQSGLGSGSSRQCGCDEHAITHEIFAAGEERILGLVADAHVRMAGLAPGDQILRDPLRDEARDGEALAAFSAASRAALSPAS